MQNVFKLLLCLELGHCYLFLVLGLHLQNVYVMSEIQRQYKPRARLKASMGECSRGPMAIWVNRCLLTRIVQFGGWRWCNVQLQSLGLSNFPICNAFYGFQMILWHRLMTILYILHVLHCYFPLLWLCYCSFGVVLPVTWSKSTIFHKFLPACILFCLYRSSILCTKTAA